MILFITTAVKTSNPRTVSSNLRLSHRITRQKRKFDGVNAGAKKNQQ
jgi:hypothetical protein